MNVDFVIVCLAASPSALEKISFIWFVFSMFTCIYILNHLILLKSHAGSQVFKTTFFSSLFLSLYCLPAAALPAQATPATPYCPRAYTVHVSFTEQRRIPGEKPSPQRICSSFTSSYLIFCKHAKALGRPTRTHTHKWYVLSLYSN